MLKMKISAGNCLTLVSYPHFIDRETEVQREWMATPQVSKVFGVADSWFTSLFIILKGALSAFFFKSSHKILFYICIILFFNYLQ